MNTFVCVWPDGTWCLEEEVGQFNWKSDDYEILAVPLEVDIESYVSRHNKPRYASGNSITHGRRCRGRPAYVTKACQLL